MDTILWAAWGLLYIVCAFLGFVPDASGFGKVLLILNSLLFFVPGAILLYRGQTMGKPVQVRRVRLVCILSLGITTVAVIANVFSAYGSALLGRVLENILMLVSVPMYCGQYRIIGLFLWACLLVASFKKKG